MHPTRKEARAVPKAGLVTAHAYSKGHENCGLSRVSSDQTEYPLATIGMSVKPDPAPYARALGDEGWKTDERLDFGSRIELFVALAVFRYVTWGYNPRGHQWYEKYLGPAVVGLL